MTCLRICFIIAMAAGSVLSQQFLQVEQAPEETDIKAAVAQMTVGGSADVKSAVTQILASLGTGDDSDSDDDAEEDDSETSTKAVTKPTAKTATLLQDPTEKDIKTAVAQMTVGGSDDVKSAVTQVLASLGTDDDSDSDDDAEEGDDSETSTKAAAKSTATTAALLQDDGEFDNEDSADANEDMEEGSESESAESQEDASDESAGDSTEGDESTDDEAPEESESADDDRDRESEVDSVDNAEDDDASAALIQKGEHESDDVSDSDAGDDLVKTSSGDSTELNEVLADGETTAQDLIDGGLDKDDAELVSGNGEDQEQLVEDLQAEESSNDEAAAES